MRSLKAIIAGSAFIIFVILLLQLVYIFAAVAYNALARDYPFLNDIAGSFRYIVGIPVFIAVMFAGGYITANIARTVASVRVGLHGMVVGLITAGGMIYPTLENSVITTTGIVVLVMALTATIAGGYYWQKGNRIN
jgi:hypothetical protein